MVKSLPEELEKEINKITQKEIEIKNFKGKITNLFIVTEMSDYSKKLFIVINNFINKRNTEIEYITKDCKNRPEIMTLGHWTQLNTPKINEIKKIEEKIMGAIFIFNINNLLKSNIFISYKDGKITLEKKEKISETKENCEDVFKKEKNIFN
jgi:hypothetical protein